MLLLKISLLSYCSFFVFFSFILILFNFSPRKDTHQTQTVKITLVLHCFNHLYFLDEWNEKIQRKIFYYTFYIMLIKNQGLFRFQRLEPPESQTDYLRAKWKNKKVLYWKQNFKTFFLFSKARTTNWWIVIWETLIVKFIPILLNLYKSYNVFLKRN